MKPCASCHELKPAGELSQACACGRETCEACLIPMYEEDAGGPEDVAGWICQRCADELEASGNTEPGQAPWRREPGLDAVAAVCRMVERWREGE